MKPSEISTKQIKTWDVFLQNTKFRRYKPLTWFSAIIRKVTWSYWNHSSECLILDGKPYMIESLSWWITLREWKDRVDEPYERDIMRLRYDKPFYESERDYCIKALMELDKKYDRLGVFKMWIYVLFWRWNKSSTTSESQRWCSEYTAYMKGIEWRPFYMPWDFAKNDDFTILWK